MYMYSLYHKYERLRQPLTLAKIKALYGARVSLGHRIRMRKGLDVRVLSLAQGALRIGDNVFFNNWCTVDCQESIQIGDGTIFGPGCAVFDNDHDYTAECMSGNYVTSPVVIGKNVWLGAHVTVTRGVTIGDNVVVAANAVVTHDIPANCIAGGVPAKVIRMLDNDEAATKEVAGALSEDTRGRLFYVAERYSQSYIGKHTAIGKAREDVECILAECGCEPIEVMQNGPDVTKESSAALKLRRRLFSSSDWKRRLGVLGSGDTVFIQFPVHNHSIGVSNYLASLAHQGVRIVLIVHDLESFRIVKNRTESVLRRLELQREEGLLLEVCARIVFHNERMRERARELFGERVYAKSVALGCFDYLLSDELACEADSRLATHKDEGVIIAGNLLQRKAGYAYELPDDVPFVLYGPNYTGAANKSPNVRYEGVFSPDELPIHLRGSFGLVWDGPSADSCVGAYGEYLAVNNPHKASLYLASGIPVIIWEKAALASFVITHGCGITVASLSEIGQRIEALDNAAYAKMVENTHSIARKLRSGEYLRRALTTIMSELSEER